MYDSPYFGSMGSGSIGQAQDRAYEAYLANKPATTDPRTAVGGVPQTGAYEGQSVSELIANRAIDPSLAYGATVQPVGTQVTADQIVDPRSGQVTGDISTPVTTATVAQADAVTPTDAATMTAATSADKVARSCSTDTSGYRYC